MNNRLAQILHKYIRKQVLLQYLSNKSRLQICNFHFLYNIRMSQPITIKDLSNAVNYFNSLLIDKIDIKLFQRNLMAVEEFLRDASMSQGCPKELLQNIFIIFVSKYYQIFTQSYQVITEQYLQNKFAFVVKTLYQEKMDKGKLSKNIFALCLAANINKLKQEISENPKNNDTMITLLQFDLSLLEEVSKRSQFKIQQFYPKIMSLCSNSIRKDVLSLKAFELILQTMKMLIMTNGCFSKDEFADGAFEQECKKRIIQDIEYLINRHSKMEISFQLKLKSFAIFLMTLYQSSSTRTPQQQIDQLSALSISKVNIANSKAKLFSSVILFAQICSLAIDINSYSLLQRQTINESYKNLFKESIKRIVKAEVNIELKKQQFSKIIYLAGRIELSENDEDEVFHSYRQLIKYIFHIRKNHCLITIPHHACTIPLNKLMPSHTRSNYPTKFVDVQYEKQLKRMITEIIPFYQLQTELLEYVKRFFSSISDSSRLCLLRYLTDSLVECEYQLDMSLSNLYLYLQLLLSLRFTLVTAPLTLQWYSLAYALFQMLASKSESVKSLKASYVEQELLISITIQIISYTHRYLKRYYLSNPIISNRVKLTQSSILLTQKILNSLAEESYIIRLITVDSLFTFSEDKSLSQALESIHAALIHRNKNNLDLMLNIISITQLNQIDYEQLAEFYMNHQNSEIILRDLLPRISIQRCRMCILTVQKWWLLFTKTVIEHLNGKEMKANDEKTQSFYVKDGENVCIKNALGVIILELSDKWLFYLRSPKKEVIVDMILELSRANPGMVFFRSFFTKIIKEFNSIIRECLGYEQQTLSITCSKKKVKTDYKPTKKPQKNEFYDRMRLKIYQIFTNIPKDNYNIYQNEAKTSFKSVLEPQHDQVKREYLFNNNIDLKRQYDLGKQVLELLQQQ